MMLFTVTMLALMLLAGLMALSEIRQFRRKRGYYRLRRLTVRLSMSGMLIFLLGCILVGVRVFHLQEPDGMARLFLAFWGCITLLVGGVLCLVIADLHSIGDDVKQDTDAYWQEVVASVVQQNQQQPPKDS